METNTYNVNHLDADAHLPPRKRLLAGLKRQNSDVNSPAPSNPINAGNENDALLNSACNFGLSNTSLSNEEIVEASRMAALKAAKVAEAARANAEEKAAKAAKAVSAAKSALDLVAILSDEVASKEKFLKKNKMKKHVTVEALYNKNKGKTNCRTDEELARKLHQTINSSPRILSNSSGSDVKNHKCKRLKSSTLSSGVPVREGNQPSTATLNGNVAGGAVESEGSVKKIDLIMVDLNTSNPENGDQLKFDNGEGCQLSRSERADMSKREVSDSFARKRGRIKQKKLPLSICSIRDQTSPKEDDPPVFSMGHSGNSLTSLEKTSMWKCQSFKSTACVKQNKVVQS